MRKTITRACQDIVGLIYPNLCMACERKVPPRKQMVCVSCRVKLLPTNYHLNKENPFTERFWGRIPIEAGAAMFPFVQGGKTQHLIHQLKYNKKFSIGVELGKWYGHQLKKSPFFQKIDIIIPVPLHPEKEYKRGYNQADAIAIGLAETMQLPWSKKVLKRGVFSDSQTTKSRMARFENVMKAFYVNLANPIRHKHVLLVDDVLTTGATLEACATKLLAVDNTKVSLATIAITQS